MSTAVIGGLMGVGIATFVASYFYNKPAEISARSGRRRLYYSSGHRVFIQIVVAALAIAMLHTIQDHPDDPAMPFVLGFFTAVVGGYLIIVSHFLSLEFDDKSIHVFSPWRRSRVIAWDDIEFVREGFFISTNTIRTKTSGRIFVDDAMSGSSEFLERCKSQARRNRFK